MAFSVVATSASRPVPDQLGISYELRRDGVKVDGGSVTMAFENDGLTQAERRQRIREIFRRTVRARVRAAMVAEDDFAHVQAAIAAGNLNVGEND